MSKKENRKKEIVDVCLNRLVEKGLFNTSARDLADAVDMQVSGLYYYFRSKDELVAACAEEAGIRMEDVLLLPVLECLDDTNEYVEFAAKKMEETIPMMRFFTQACTVPEHRELLQPIFDRLQARHKEYAVKFAEKLNCSPEKVEPYMYACVAIVANHMIFEQETYYTKPFQLIADAIQNLKNIRE